MKTVEVFEDFDACITRRGSKRSLVHMVSFKAGETYRRVTDTVANKIVAAGKGRIIEPRQTIIDAG